jgi:hypothetical protein
LDIDVQALVASTSEVKKEIDSLKKQQSDLAKSGDTSSKAFVENAATLKLLNAEYSASIKAITEVAKSTDAQINRTQLLEMALKGEVSSINEAREANKLLNQLRNSANVLTQEGQLEIIKLNAAIDENNEFIKRNADQYLQQKINIGNYSESIKDALQNLNPLNGGLAGFTQRSQEAGGVGNLLKTSLSGVGQGILGVTKASLAFIATPIGAVLALIAVVLGTLYSIFSKLDPVMDKIEQLTAGLGGAFTKVQQIVVSFVSNITSLGDAFSKIGKFISDPIGAIKNFAEEVGNAAKAAADLKAAEQDLGDLKDIYEVRNKSIESQITLDKIRLKNKDLTAKEEQEIEKRINDNYEKLSNNKSEVNKKTLDLSIQNAINTQTQIKKINAETLDNEIRNGELVYANYLLNQGRITKAAYDRLKETTNAVIDSKNQQAEDEERSQDKIEKARAKAEENAQKAEATKNKNRQEAAKLVDKAIAQSKTELDLFIAQQGIRAKSLEEEIKLAEQVRDKKLKILDQELKAEKLTQSEYNLQKLTTQQEFLKKQAEVAVAFADQELKAFLDSNKSKLDANKFLSDELVNQEIDRLNRIAEEEAKAQTKRLEVGTINQQQYNDAITAIDLKYEESKKLLDQQKVEADIEKRAIDLENQIAINGEDLNLLIERLDAQKAAEIKTSGAKGAELKLIDEKYAKAKIQLTTEVENSRLNIVGNSFSQIAGLLKENTLASKALAIAAAAINTYTAITGQLAAFAGIPIPGYAIAQAIATGAVGLAQVAKIGGIKFEKGGIQEVGGKRHIAGGTKFYGEDGTTFEAEKGEGIGVLNRGAFAAFMQFNNANSSGEISTPTFMAGGGIITQGVQTVNQGMDLNTLLTVVKNLPAPVVTVEDINYQTNEVVRVVNGANF